MTRPTPRGTANVAGSQPPADDPAGNDSTAAGTSLRAVAREAARQMESRIILETLAQHRWNRRRTAEALRISYRSLMYKMKYCKLRDEDQFQGPEAES